MTRRYPGIVLALLFVASSAARGEATPSLVAAYDEEALRRAGVAVDAAGLSRFLRGPRRGDVTPASVDALVARLGGDEFGERERAAKELTAVGVAAQGALRRAQAAHADPEVRRRCGDCLLAIEARLDPNLTMSAVRRLIHLRAAGAAECLLAVLPSVDWEVQDEIFHGLPRLALRDGGRVDPALLPALEDKSPVRRAVAALAVALAGDGADRLRVRKLLADEDAEVRLRAAQGLLAGRDAAGLPALVALLNEPAVEVSWSAEELLHWVAGETAPAAKVGAASAAERQKAVAAWNEWRAQHATKLDWDRIEQAPRRPGLYFACAFRHIWLGGCTGKRWTLDSTEGAADALLLPGNQVVLVRSHVTAVKCDLAGNEFWTCDLKHSRYGIACQRLPNGNLYLIGCRGAVEVDAGGREVSAVDFEDELELCDAWRLRSGRLTGYQHKELVSLDALSGRVLRVERVGVSFEKEQKGAVLPDGRCVLADLSRGNLLETDARGAVRWAVRVHDPVSVEALRDDHYLVSTADPYRVLEIDSAGRTSWEVYPDGIVFRVRSVLGRVRIGFDRPRPPQFNLESVGHRLAQLGDRDPEVRCRGALLLGRLEPADRAALAGLVAALDDEDAAVRTEARKALQRIGEPAVDALIPVLKKGTDTARVGAARVLRELGPRAEAAAASLVALVEDRGAGVEARRGAALALGSVGPTAKGTAPALIELLGDEEQPTELRAAAARSLGALGEAGLPAIPLFDRLLGRPTLPAELSAAVTDSLSGMGKDGVAALARAVTEGGPETRRHAIGQLAQLGVAAAPALPALEKACADADDIFRSDPHAAEAYRFEVRAAKSRIEKAAAGKLLARFGWFEAKVWPRTHGGIR
jgi:HEAT repeat protein